MSAKERKRPGIRVFFGLLFWIRSVTIQAKKRNDMSLGEKNNKILSVGIDIGTTTTSMILSKLAVENTAMVYMAPNVELTSKEIIYRSPVYMTPLISEEQLDGDKIREIIETEYRNAGITPNDVDSGAVIITGESALKENARLITEKLSEFAGDFVVATAGPDLESIIAGRGAGTESFSKVYGCVAANLDIGGGTTNISVFNCGDLVAQTCIDVGGRLIRYDDSGEITYVSKRFNDVGKERNIYVVPGMRVDDNKMALAGDLLADVILDAIHEEHYSFTRISTTKNSRKLNLNYPIQFITLSGGVADCYYNDEQDLYRYNDLGVAIAQALKKKLKTEPFEVVESMETIRATVVGAGIYTTEVSGSTISYSEEVFPLKNLPVFKVGEKAEQALYECDTRIAREELGWFLDQSQNEKIGICIKGLPKASYQDIINLAKSLVEIDEECLGWDTPLVVLSENDMAKALGQMLEREIKNDKCVLCLDKITMDSGDYIDIGKPILNGIAVPIVIKTLIFN